MAEAKTWFTPGELAGLPGLPTSDRGVQKLANREGWTWRKRAGRGGGREYALLSLPRQTQAALLLQHGNPSAVRPEGEVLAGATTVMDWDALARHFDRAPERMKAEAYRMNRLCQRVALLTDTGVCRSRRAACIAVWKAERVPVPTLQRWLRKVTPYWHERDRWPLLLLDQYAGRTARVECSPAAWDWYCEQYLTRKQPSHADTYDRLRLVAQKQGWTIPSAKTLERRIEQEISLPVRILRREGEEALARRLPVQVRDRSHFSAGQAVNGDGLKFDRLWIAFADEVLNTTTAWFWQDLYSNKLLAWRVAKTENTDMFRLATYDLTAICAPSDVWIDNTRVSANKAMTAGAAGRHRFRDDPEDGMGALVQLGMNVHFTNPDAVTGNPGAKPIERAFGIGGIHEMVVTNPALRDRGYNRATAIPLAEFCAVLADEVARFNARDKRETRVCGGVQSFNEAWAASVAQTPPRRLTESQRRLLLMARETVRADARSGVVRIDAGRGPRGRNEYWTEALMEFCGQKLVVLFDPDDLTRDAHIYSLDGRYLCAAQHRPGVAFDDRDTGREHAKFKKRMVKATKAAAASQKRMSDLEHAALYTGSKPASAAPEAPSKVARPVFKRTPDPSRDAGLPRVANGESFDDRFVRAMDALDKQFWSKPRI